ncbi:MAG: hypothetical protein HN995_14095 [Candidatus Marinimicrobia bacterium]|nr:hypothetical protein [Candidatus Neomarinimicrobiota bacterium]MBT3575532.1 hypothetical protein [Candidatus Neomarinimicrobiota bacterium]MBT3679629.1 hypothetical protein [Candidatus Neomarinimicrobiota bacterium]MBT3950586.1 hypothetical protein [Candidatus Neomarinimicrobiota bacterium]MBT4253427.1 hypothetical protein [Candidatus Neomarinimicrobiota bacterium]
MIILSVIGNAGAIEVTENSFRMGFGMAFPQKDDTSIMTTQEGTLYLPIDLGRFRIEPTFSHKVTKEKFVSMNYSTVRETVLGSGLFLKNGYGETLIYYGLRAGIGKSSNLLNDSSQSITFQFWGPAFGGEHYFTHHFSLGGEAMFLYESGKHHHYWRSASFETEEMRIRIIFRFLL